MTRGNPNLQERSLQDSLFWGREENSFTHTLLLVKVATEHTGCKATALSSHAINTRKPLCVHISSKAHTHGHRANFTSVQPVQSHRAPCLGGPQAWF